MKNRYFVSVDIEGISGVSGDLFASAGQRNYDIGRRYMTHDTNAVIEGILQADPEAEIVVRDAHCSAVNLDLTTLHPRASLIQGWGTSMNMMEGIDSSFRAAFLVGYHAGGHNDGAVLSHAFMESFDRVLVNGVLVNETGIAALCAEPSGVPIAFVSGDDQCCLEAEQQIPGVTNVAVKKSFARESALSLPLARAAELLKAGAEKALRQPFSRPAFKAPYRVEIELFGNAYAPSIFAHLHRVLDGDRYSFEREGRLVRFDAATAAELVRLFMVLVHVIVGIRAMQKGE